MWIFFACNLLGAVMTWFFVPETRGIDADEVDYRECQEAVQRKAMGKQAAMEGREMSMSEAGKMEGRELSMSE